MPRKITLQLNLFFVFASIQILEIRQVHAQDNIVSDIVCARPLAEITPTISNSRRFRPDRFLKVDGQSFGQGVAGRIDVGVWSQSIFLFGVQEPNDFPCEGYYLWGKDGVLKCPIVEQQDKRIRELFQNQAELSQTLRVISLLNSSTASSKFDPRRMILIRDYLRGLGKEKAYLALQEFDRVCPPGWRGWDGTGFLANCVFGVGIGKLFDQEDALVPEISKELAATFPSYPVVEIGGIPFCLTHGFQFTLCDAPLKPLKLEELPDLPTPFEIRPQISVNEIITAIESDSYKDLFRDDNGRERKLLVFCQLRLMVLDSSFTEFSHSNEKDITRIAAELAPYGNYCWDWWTMEFRLPNN